VGSEVLSSLVSILIPIFLHSLVFFFTLSLLVLRGAPKTYDWPLVI
jgi:hypothetical protein